MTGCADVELYFDGELQSKERRDAFRIHLAGCERCQEKLHGLMQEQVVTSTREG